MQYIYNITNWFFGIDVIFELFFAITTLAVCLYAFKIYNLSKQGHPKLLAYAFLFFSLSYFIESITNFAIISKLNQNICTILKIKSVYALNLTGIYLHILLFTIGLVTLTYMILNIKDKKAYSLLLIISIFFVLSSTNKIYAFYLLSTILLIYISSHYLTNYIRNKQIKTLLVLIAFIFLLLGNAHFMFAVNHVPFYIIGHFLELAAYLLILLNLILVFKNGKKKKQT